MSSARTLRELFSVGADDAPAITAPGGVPLTHRDVAMEVTFLTGHGRDGSDNALAICYNAAACHTLWRKIGLKLWNTLAHCICLLHYLLGNRRLLLRLLTGLHRLLCLHLLLQHRNANIRR